MSIPPDLETEDYFRELKFTRRIRKLGMALYLIGTALCVVGIISVVSAYADFLTNLESLKPDEFGMTPQYAWCFYAGLPFLGIGMAVRVYAARHDRPRSRATPS